jgi:hypothetical protein
MYRIEVIGYLVSAKVFYDIDWLTNWQAAIGGLILAAKGRGPLPHVRVGCASGR